MIYRLLNFSANRTFIKMSELGFKAHGLRKARIKVEGQDTVITIEDSRKRLLLFLFSIGYPWYIHNQQDAEELQTVVRAGAQAHLEYLKAIKEAKEKQ